MRRWAPWLAVPFLASWAVLAARATSPGLFEDSDTRVLLDALVRRGDPWSWFAGDWPLGNHFYRPVSTLFFEADLRAHGQSAAGFGLTNALLAVASVWLLFWLVAEWTRRPGLAAASAALFGAWHLGGAGWVPPICWALAVAVWIGLLRGGMAKAGPCLTASVSWAFVATQALPVAEFGSRIVGWLPGRTASTMTVFALLAMASAARFWRLTSGRRTGPMPSPTDVPGTRGSTMAARDPRPSDTLWAAFALLGCGLALLCYEQAVMLPAAIAGLAVSFWAAGSRPRSWPVLGAFVLLGAYLVVRSRLVPQDPSGYQLQQFRSGPGVWLSLSNYLFPGWNSATTAWTSVQAGPEVLLLPEFWALVAPSVGNVVLALLVWRDRDRAWIVAAWCLAFLAFLPMAWLKPFEHYHYWPMALRSLAVVGLALVAGRATVSAVAPRAVRAPPRPRPAPGSLPRP